MMRYLAGEIVCWYVSNHDEVFSRGDCLLVSSKHDEVFSRGDVCW